MDDGWWWNHRFVSGRRRNRRVQDPRYPDSDWRGDSAHRAPAPLNSSEATLQQGVSRRGSRTELSGEGPFVEALATTPCRLKFSALREWNRIKFPCPIPSPPNRQQQKRTGPVPVRRSTCLLCTALNLKCRPMPWPSIRGGAVDEGVAQGD